MSSKKKAYEVYICKYNGEIVYIGEGALGRHNHCTSGTSHVYELNELRFTGDRNLFTVEVKYFQTKKIASEIEKELIKIHKPKFNKKGNGCTSVEDRKLFRGLILEKLNTMRKTQTQKEKLIKCVDEFLEFHTDQMLREEGLLFRKRHIYEKCGLHQLSTVVNNLLSGRVGDNSMPKMFEIALEYAYNKHYTK